MQSMTGFGAATRKLKGASITCEIRSVNHRFVALRCSLPDGCTSFEPLIERMVRDRIERGSVNVAVSVEAESTARLPIDVATIKQLRKQLDRIKSALGYKEPIRFESLLALPGVLQPANSHGPRVRVTWGQLRPVVGGAISQLHKMRRQEGAAARAELAMRIGLVKDIAGRIAAKAPQVLDHFRGRIVGRLQQVTPGAERTPASEALYKEIASMLDRCDISEEVQRLGHHVGQFEKTLDVSGKVGRRLDFLNQEMLRETNTIASKAAETRVIDDAIAIKSELERIKEQVENVE